ncbi:MAG: hypothetical protein WBF73_17195 [Bradyrhizobium sp.]
MAVLSRSKPGLSQNRFELCGPPCDQQPAASRKPQNPGGHIFMPTIQPDNSDPMPLRTSPHRVGTLMMRFVGLLFLTVAVLALLYSR